MDLEEIGVNAGNWVDSAQDGDYWRTLVNVVNHGVILVTPWAIEPGGFMPHSQGLSNNPYLEPNQPNSSY